MFIVIITTVNVVVDRRGQHKQQQFNQYFWIIIEKMFTTDWSIGDNNHIAAKYQKMSVCRHHDITIVL